MNKEEKSSNKCPICGRPTHKKSEYCIFHASAEEKTEEELKKALKEYIQEIKEEGKDYDFEGFIFVGNINFKEDLNIIVFKKANFRNATFKGEADFKGATFERDADFKGATFKQYANFTGATFEGDANFTGATFEGKAGFWKTTFKQYAYFTRAIFKRETDFYKNTFKQYAYFTSATFEENANFWSTTFMGKADFKGATFEGGAGLGATFKGDADFSIKAIGEYISFYNALFNQGRTLVIKTTDVKNEVTIDFEKVCLENVYLELFLGEKTLINFTNALIRSTVIKKSQIENHILQEEKKEFSKAKEVYLLLKNNFHSIGRYEDESWAFTKEKDMERFSHSFPCYKEAFKKDSKIEKFPILKWIKKGYFKKWIISAFSNMIYGYGEKPWNVIKTAVAIILIFALSFSFIGLGNPEIIELKGTAIHQNSGNTVDLESKGLLKNNVIRNFPDSLYFSTITFTTLGYGDFRPLEGLGRILAGSEAFLGAIMMALFVYTFARRTGGR